EGGRIAGYAPNVLEADDRPVAPLISLLETEDVLQRLVMGDGRLAAQDGEGAIAFEGRLMPELQRPQVDIPDRQLPRPQVDIPDRQLPLGPQAVGPSVSPHGGSLHPRPRSSARHPRDPE